MIWESPILGNLQYIYIDIDIDYIHYTYHTYTYTIIYIHTYIYRYIDRSMASKSSANLTET